MAPERAAVERQLETILASDGFSSAPKMRSLLRYLVEATLAGDVERLKGYAIGVDVFERGADFDPGADPIVRVQAGRLRKLLESYYRSAGVDDPVRIDIPKGGYAVTFSALRDAPAAAPATPAASAPRVPDSSAREAAGGLPDALSRYARPLIGGLAVLIALLALFVALDRRDAPDRTAAPDTAVEPGSAIEPITLAVLPFVNMTRDESNVHFADGLTDALTTALARVKSVSLASRTSAFQYREAKDLRQVGRELGVHYIVEGGVQRDGARIRVNVQLIDALTGAHLWAQEYDRPADDELAVQSELVTTLAAEIRPQLFSAAKRAIAAHPDQAVTAWQLFIKSTWVPGEARNSLAWEMERVALASRALEIDPDLGQADSVLADKLAYLANVDPPSDTAERRAKAARHARRALELAPDDADALFNVSIHHWHAGRIEESLDATRRTLELDPNHVLARFLVKAVPYTCAPAPQPVIDGLTAFDATAISSDNPVRWVTLTWIALLYLNNGDVRRAADAARRSDQIFRTPDTVYRLAAILVQLGDTEPAVEMVGQQRESWPNLDPRHYADVAIRRRCTGAPRSDFLHRVYSDLADAVETAARSAAPETPGSP